MKKKKSLLAAALFSVLLAACSTPEGSSQGGSGGGSNSGGDIPTSSTSGSGGGEILGPSKWNQIVRLHYHQDDGAYSTKRLWVWASGVDGHDLGEITFEGTDDFGVYTDLDLQEEPFDGRNFTSISFIVKNVGTWSGQSADIQIPFNRFTYYASTTEEGRDKIDVYAVAGAGGSIDTYALQSAALGDRVETAYAGSDWKSIVVTGAGTEDGRAAEDIGKVATYELYAFDRDYYIAKAGTNQPGVTIEEPDDADYLVTSGSPNANTFTISLSEDIDPRKNYVVNCVFTQDTSRTKTKSVSMVNLYDTEKFESDYVYTGDDLGFTYENGVATYRLWAPTASRVQLYRYLTGETSSVNHTGDVVSENDMRRSNDMEPGEKGTWVLQETGFPVNPYYTYNVQTANGTNETADPYAKAGGINGLRSYAMSPADWDETDPTSFSDHISALGTTYSIDRPNELTVYEAHIRDLTMDDTWVSNSDNPRGTFPAFSESGTTYAAGGLTVKTGFDHIVETGVNAVQLLPVFDFDNDERTLVDESGAVTMEPGYNWGYNPMNYNMVEGSYSSDPYEPTVRISEYKELIDALASNGIRTIMDVVYNHLSSVSNNPFNKTVPYYFFRLDANGNYIDGSGTGNVTASERPMVEKYIVDSCVFWAEEYGVKGFRFDLMGCLTVDCMRAVKDALYAVDPEIVVYGEGWTGGDAGYDGTKLASTGNVYSQLYDGAGGALTGAVGAFNDHGRDGLKGNTTYGSPDPAYGFISQGAEHLSEDTLLNAAYHFIGSNRNVGGNPIQTVNYVACHDNYTLYDQMNYCLGSGTTGITDNADAVAATVAMNASVAMSQGIAFINGGDEIFRQKYLTPEDPYFATIDGGDAVLLGDGNKLVRNSYAYGDECNSFKWDRKVTYNDEYLKTVEAIKFRNDHMGSLFGLSYEEVTGDTPLCSVWGSLYPNGSDITSIGINLNSRDGAETYYLFLGGRCADGEWNDISIGNDTVEVVYSSNGAHTEGTSFTISNFTMGIGRYELLLVKKLA